jgi:ppGpp synthetase/RelA/SpoT-type nucleotidyltranferase
MANWVTPQFSRKDVDAAGRALLKPSIALKEYVQALKVINNWRSSHSFPLNTFQATLRRAARRLDDSCITAQRLKRLSSIDVKLRRFKWIKLSEMQDIGGCRAVVQAVDDVRQLADRYKKGNLKHKLVDEDPYIQKPKGTGYRGHHLIYQYKSDRTHSWDGLKIEMQLRSPLQHAWATASETVGTFVGQALKSGQGDMVWRRFFALMGGVLAMREGTPPVPKVPDTFVALRDEVRRLARELDVIGQLENYRAVLQSVPLASVVKNPRYFLVTLDAAARSVSVTAYKGGAAQLRRASADYLAIEQTLPKRPGADAVLVSVESLAALQRAYPNYFLDTHLFIQAVREAIE